MNEKDTDVYFSLNEKKLNICVFKNIDDSVIFFNEENINIKINSITENTDFEIILTIQTDIQYRLILKFRCQIITLPEAILLTLVEAMEAAFPGDFFYSC